MAQTTQITLDNQTFPSFRSKLNESLSALNTLNSGTSRPSSAVAGTIWLDTTNATNPTLKFYDGADDISLATIDYSANTVNWLDSSVSLTSPVAISGNATAGAEIRLPEDTDNGSHYVALKAPDSIASDVTFTLPSADGTTDQVLKTDGSGNLSFVDASTGISWQSVQTTGFTASAGNAYPCNTTSAGFTITLPATPSAGDQVQIVDYAGTFDTNNLVISPNGNKIEGGTSNFQLNGEREGVILTYIDSTQGWIATSGINEGTDALEPATYSVDFLVIAGGGGSQGGDFATGCGGSGAGGYRNSFSTETSGGGGSSEASLTFTPGTVYTITVGGGGAAGDANGSGVTNGVDSSISGTGITTITSIGGGKNASYQISGASSGGSGGGGSYGFETGASGTANQGYAGGDALIRTGGGGGGAGAVGSNSTSSNGGNGGNGLASSITGSSITRGGGGGGGVIDLPSTNTVGSGGTGGGGNGGKSDSGGGSVVNPTAGSVNTGGGAGGPTGNDTASGTTGGSGVVILRMPTASYSGTTTGSPTVSTDGSDTILTYTGSGSYTA